MAKKKRIAAKRTVLVKKKVAAPKKKATVKNKKTAPKAHSSPKITSQRLVIHTNDITKILGINIRTAQRLLQTIRESLGRKKKDYVSIREFAEYVHLGEEEVRQNLSTVSLN
jgi:phage antirepressor YoqD-like protein